MKIIDKIITGFFGVNFPSDFPQLIKKFIEQLYHTPGLEAISYIHPLGFIDVPVYKLFNSAKRIHLHIWEPTIPQLNSDIHKHKAETKSYILCGTMVNYEYTVSKEEKHNRSEYKVEYLNGRSARVRTAVTAHCIEKTRKEYKAGNFYSVPLEQYHRTEVSPKSFTATLFIGIDDGLTDDIVLGEFDWPDRADFNHTEISKESLYKNLRTLNHSL